MKKTIFLTLILTLLLAACGGQIEETTGNNPSEGFDSNAGELPLSTKLALGTLKLEDTDRAVASDQAADLLPLWQVLNSLLNSDTSAPEEIQAVIEQIQETMTSEQMETIEAMGLTREDISATMQDPAIEFGGGEGLPEGSDKGQGPGAGVPGSGMGLGKGGPDGQELSPEQIATAQAHRAEDGGAGFGNRTLTPLVEAVIELLESKIQ